MAVYSFYSCYQSSLSTTATSSKNGGKRSQEQENRSLSPLLLMQPETCKRPKTLQQANSFKFRVFVFYLRLGTTSLL
ncbi:hypothetical protein YC2023_064027 [Brassica napus]